MTPLGEQVPDIPDPEDPTSTRAVKANTYQTMQDNSVTKPSPVFDNPANARRELLRLALQREEQVLELQQGFYEKLAMTRRLIGSDGTFPNHVVNFHLSKDMHSISAKDGSWSLKAPNAGSMHIDANDGGSFSFPELYELAKTSPEAANILKQINAAMGYARQLVMDFGPKPVAQSKVG